MLKNPELKDFPDGPLAHFCRHGMTENRDVSPYFNAQDYIRRHPAAGAGPMPPFLYALDNLECPEHRLLLMPSDDET